MTGVDAQRLAESLADSFAKGAVVLGQIANAEKTLDNLTRRIEEARELRAKEERLTDEARTRKDQEIAAVAKAVEAERKRVGADLTKAQDELARTRKARADEQILREQAEAAWKERAKAEERQQAEAKSARRAELERWAESEKSALEADLVGLRTEAESLNHQIEVDNLTLENLRQQQQQIAEAVRGMQAFLPQG